MQTITTNGLDIAKSVDGDVVLHRQLQRRYPSMEK
jgi:hypothetical protein